MLEQEQNPISRRIPRRIFLAGTAAALVPLFLPKAVQAATWIELNPNSGNSNHPQAEVAEWKDVGPDAGDLNQRDWFPFDLKLARDRLLMRMHDFGGPLDVYDEILGHHGARGHARERAEYYANLSLRNHPERRSWGGYCHAVANTMSYQESLVIGRGESSFEYEGVIFDLGRVMGLYAAIHASDAELASTSSPRGIRAILAKAIDIGWAPVANIPELAGVWQRSIKKVRADLEAVEANAFGVTKVFPTSEIKGIYFPKYYDPRDRESVEGVATAARARTSGYINPELDHVIASRIARNLSIEANFT